MGFLRLRKKQLREDTKVVSKDHERTFGRSEFCSPTCALVPKGKAESPATARECKLGCVVVVMHMK